MVFLSAQSALAGARITWQPLHLEVAADISLGVIWGVIALDRDTGGHAHHHPAAGALSDGLAA